MTSDNPTELQEKVKAKTDECAKDRWRYLNMHGIRGEDYFICMRIFELHDILGVFYEKLIEIENKLDNKTKEKK